MQVKTTPFSFIGIVRRASRWLKWEAFGPSSRPRYWILSMNRAAAGRYSDLWMVTGNTESDYIRRRRRQGFRCAWDICINNLPAVDENAWDYVLRLETLIENDPLPLWVPHVDGLYFKQGKEMFLVVSRNPLWKLASAKGVPIAML